MEHYAAIEMFSKNVLHPRKILLFHCCSCSYCFEYLLSLVFYRPGRDLRLSGLGEGSTGTRVGVKKTIPMVVA